MSRRPFSIRLPLISQVVGGSLYPWKPPYAHYTTENHPQIHPIVLQTSFAFKTDFSDPNIYPFFFRVAFESSILRSGELVRSIERIFKFCLRSHFGKCTLFQTGDRLSFSLFFPLILSSIKCDSQLIR